MAAPNALKPYPPEFERFLYASVGEDRNGHVVTVLSTLARLGLDPWKETAHLVALGRDAARDRLVGCTTENLIVGNVQRGIDGCEDRAAFGICSHKTDYSEFDICAPYPRT